MTDPRTPATEAGRQLLHHWQHQAWRERILAIEAEARDRVIAEIRQSLDLLPTWDRRTVPGGLHVHRNSVLAILDALSAAHDKEGTDG